MSQLNIVASNINKINAANINTNVDHTISMKKDSRSFWIHLMIQHIAGPNGESCRAVLILFISCIIIFCAKIGLYLNSILFQAADSTRHNIPFLIRELFRCSHEFAYSIFEMDLRDDMPARRGFQSCCLSFTCFRRFASYSRIFSSVRRCKICRHK